MTDVLSLPYDEAYVVAEHFRGLRSSGRTFHVETKVEKLSDYVHETGTPKLIICDHEHFEDLKNKVRQDEPDGPLASFKNVPMVVIFHGSASLVEAEGFNIVEIYSGHQGPKNIHKLVEKHLGDPTPRATALDKRGISGEKQKPMP